MPTLISNDLTELAADLMREFSILRTVIPITKTQFRAGLADIDATLNTSEVTIFQGIVNPTVKSWLQTNQQTGRMFIERVERKRKEVL